METSSSARLSPSGIPKRRPAGATGAGGAGPRGSGAPILRTRAAAGGRHRSVATAVGPRIGRLLHGVARQVAPVTVRSAKNLQQRVADRIAVGGRLQVPLGHVGRVLRAVHQNVVPGTVLRRAGAGDPLVPLLAALERRIDVEDDAAVVEPDVVDDLADEEPGGPRACRS